MLSMKALSFCMLATTASASNLRTTAAAGGPGIVMVDGGSTGSKLSSFSTRHTKTKVKGKKGKKVLTACDLDMNLETVVPGTPEADLWPLKGVSAYAYEPEKCKQTITPEIDKKKQPIPFCVDPLPNPSTETCDTDETPLPCPERFSSNEYAKFVLQQLQNMHETCEKPPCPAAANKDKVPFMATAGMRLLTKEQNIKIWEDICGKGLDSGDYTFATEESGLCGTIPGTQEAFYEWLANVAENSKPKNEDTSTGEFTGTFTVGGASAQIAVPLLSDAMVVAWTEMIVRIEEKFGDCSEIMLPGGADPIPIFSDVKKVSCARDFIDIKMRDHIEASLLPELHAQAGLTDNDNFKGLGLVSFLGLDGKGGAKESGVAGGAEKITTWAKHAQCNPELASGTTTKYETCKNKLKVALNTDTLFVAVKQFFHHHDLKVEHFNFNTPGATPAQAFNKANGAKAHLTEPPGASEVDIVGQLADSQSTTEDKLSRLRSPQNLADALEKFCSVPGHANFGFHGENNCMRATFTSLFGTEFFDSSAKDVIANNDVDVDDDYKKARQHYVGAVTDLNYHGYDWDKGAKAAFDASAATSTEFLETYSSSEQSVLNTPVSFHSLNYMDGAAMHFAATATKQ